VPREGHAGFGGRPWETDREQSRYRAHGRPNNELIRASLASDPARASGVVARGCDRVVDVGRPVNGKGAFHSIIRSRIVCSA
jgi:hypothetical protein